MSDIAWHTGSVVGRRLAIGRARLAVCKILGRSDISVLRAVGSLLLRSLDLQKENSVGGVGARARRPVVGGSRSDENVMEISELLLVAAAIFGTEQDPLRSVAGVLISSQ
jgi:hypothetical protein